MGYFINAIPSGSQSWQWEIIHTDTCSFIAGKINCRSEIFHYERVTRAEMLANIDKWLPVFAMHLERMMIIA